MKLTVVCMSNDQTISLDVQGDLLVENFLALCSVELNMLQESIILKFNGVHLANPKQTLNSYGIKDNDMILVENRLTALPSPAQRQTNTSGSIHPKIDFSSIKVHFIVNTCSCKIHVCTIGSFENCF